ncbi:MAG TPA: adenylate/guanylate cyclase domain-containing protein [Candidatus Cybelea sp.]|nr:adenylate/guanylate cyclase domain-containing protein [Candidatus Cybelea sp.]
MSQGHRRLAAVLAADVAGYSRLMAADEAGTLQRLKTFQRKAIDPQLEQFGGRLVGSAGDSILVEFPSALQAVQCALQMQALLHAANDGEPADRRMDFRIGINLGDVIAEGGTIYGNGVNVAARLEKLSEVGGICISGSIQEQIKGKIPNALKDLGEQRLHSIPDPVRAYRIVIATARGAEEEPRAEKPARDRTTVAVLPFASMSEGKDQEHFADGLTEDLITALADDGTIAVVARNSTFVYKGKAVNVRDVGRELGADFLIEGSIRRAGTRVRVTVQLIDCETGAHAWAQRFDRDLDDVFALQDEILQTIVAHMNFGISTAAMRQHGRNAAADSTAYAHYLRARGAWVEGDEAATVKHLLAAVEVDPTYALAHSWLAFFYAYSMSSQVLDMPLAELERLSREHLEKARSAGRSSSKTLSEIALVYTMLGEHQNAIAYAEASGSASPNDFEIAMIHGWIIAASGEHERGYAIMRKAYHTQPRLPPGYQYALSDVRFLRGDYEGAAAALAQVPDPPYYLRLQQAVCLAQAGRIDEARRLAFDDVPPGYDHATHMRSLLRCYAREEDRARWREAFGKLGMVD